MRRPVLLLLLLPAFGHAGESDWHRGAVIYGVVPHRFGTEGLPAVTARLDDLAALGVDALWIVPVQPTDDPSAISYQLTDWRSVRPDFGTSDDLRALVDAAHARGLKVLLDFVPNHTSVGHPWFTAADGPHAATWWWYERHEDGRPRHEFDWAHLPNLDHRHPEVRREVVDAMTWWLRTFDVDGFRLDAVWAVGGRAPEFVPELVRALEAVKPDVFLLAEASARDPIWVRSGFDAAYDWTEAPGRWAWEGVFDDPSRFGSALATALADTPTPPDRVLRFLDNNDTGERFVARHGPEVTRVATVLLFTLPGIPLVFTGSEVGARYLPYDDGPPLTWEDPHRLRPLHRRLAELRERLPALRDGDFAPVPVLDRPSAFAFVRRAGDARVLVLADLGSAGVVRVAFPDDGRPLPTVDALTGDPVPVRRVDADHVEVPVGDRTALVLVPAG